MYFGFMNALLLYSDHRHASDTRVVTLRVVNATI